MTNKIFVGWLPYGGPAHACHFVMGRLEGMEDEDVTVLAGGFVTLTEPIWIQRCPTMDANKQMVWIHQPVQDPLWPTSRGRQVAFNVSQFASFYCLDESIGKEAVEIRNYESMLAQMHTLNSGLVSSANPLRSI
jgi:hypothetical protein